MSTLLLEYVLWLWFSLDLTETFNGTLDILRLILKNDQKRLGLRSRDAQIKLMY